ncbi:MAG: HAD family hydrolase [Alphaproteobacteria bacterium]
MPSAPLPPAMLIDLDDTILRFGLRADLSAEVALEFAHEALPLKPEELGERLEQAFGDYWADAERHRISRFRPLEEVRREIVAGLFARLRPRAPGLTEEAAFRFADRFHLYREGRLECFPGAVEALDLLKAEGVKLALITNGRSLIQREKIKRFDLAHRFDHIQIEEEHGFGKPDERAYHHAMNILGIGPQECWMIGDNLEWEVVAPQRLGIHAIWYDGYGQGLPEGSAIKPDRIIRSLMDLFE